MGDIFLAHFEPLSTNWSPFKRHSLPEYCCWPCPSLYDYSVPIFCHKAQIISDWFLEHDNEFTLLKWPPQSPDLNPIEHLWDVVEREIRILDVQLTNLQQLRDAIMTIWTKISEECLQHLVESMPQIIKAVLKAKGGPTMYLQGLPNKVASEYIYIYIYITYIYMLYIFIWMVYAIYALSTLPCLMQYMFIIFETIVNIEHEDSMFQRS